MKNILPNLAITTMVSFIACAPLLARDNLYFAGSSTVFPFATIVAEEYTNKIKGKTPVIESLGTGGGFKLFCEGAEDKYPDVAMASRPIKASETELCAKKGVANIVELPIGLDGIVIVNSKKQPVLNVSLDELYRALAAFVPGPDGKPIKNPNKKWSDINKKLPNNAITIYGPPSSSGTRDALIELAISHPAQKYFEKLQLDKKDYTTYSTMIRDDGAYIDAGENDSLIVNKVDTQPNSFGIVGYNFLYLNDNKINGALIDGFQPTIEAVQDGKYPLARKLYLYVKGENMKKDKILKQFLQEFMADKNIGDDGKLTEKGLIPIDKASRDKVRLLVK